MSVYVEAGVFLVLPHETHETIASFLFGVVKVKIVLFVQFILLKIV